MIGSTRNVTVWVYPKPCDLRKGHNGLSGLVATDFEADLLSYDERWKPRSAVRRLLPRLPIRRDRWERCTITAPGGARGYVGEDRKESGLGNRVMRRSNPQSRLGAVKVRVATLPVLRAGVKTAGLAIIFAAHQAYSPIAQGISNTFGGAGCWSERCWRRSRPGFGSVDREALRTAYR